MREFTRAELATRLAPYEEHAGQVQAVLDELQAKGVLDDVRAVQSLIHRRASRLGTRRLVRELRGKGVGAELIADAAQLLQASELERAYQVWRRKFPAPPQDTADRARHMRFLLARGFDAAVVRRILGQFENED